MRRHRYLTLPAAFQLKTPQYRVLLKAMKIRFKDYQIGLLTSLFDVSADTIRLYGKKGILAEKKHKNSNYRIFYRDDIFSMDYIMRLRAMDIPLDDISEIVCRSDLRHSRDIILERLRLTDKELARLIAVRENLYHYTEFLNKTIEKCNKPEIISKPLTFLMMDIEKSIPQTADFLKSLDPALQPLLSLYTPGTKIPLETSTDFLNKQRREEGNFVITCQDVNAVSRRKGFPSDRISIIGPSKFVTSICYTHTDSEYEFIEIVNRYIREHNLVKNGNYFAQYVMSENIHGGATDYYRVWIPIK